MPVFLHCVQSYLGLGLPLASHWIMMFSLGSKILSLGDCCVMVGGCGTGETQSKARVRITRTDRQMDGDLSVNGKHIQTRMNMQHAATSSQKYLKLKHSLQTKPNETDQTDHLLLCEMVWTALQNNHTESKKTKHASVEQKLIHTIVWPTYILPAL